MNQHFYRILRKFTALLMTVLLCFSFIGCSFTRQAEENNTSLNTEDNLVNEQFASFTNELFRDSINTDTVSLHCYLENPENYGIEDYDVTLGRYDLDNLDATNDLVDTLNELNSFDRSSLSEKQQLTYDELQMYLENELEYSDLYLFDTQLSETTGIQVQLPIVFAEYSFNEEKDVTEYLELLNDVDGYFENLIEYETIRSQNGYFMEDSIVDSIIEQCQTFIDSAADGFLVTTFDEKLDLLSSISEEDATSYKQQNITAISEHVIKGYQVLIDGLTTLKGTNQYSGGLCNYPNGSKYFEYILNNYLGWDKTVDEYDDLLDSYIKTNMLTMQVLVSKDSSLLSEFSSFQNPLTDPVSILDDLKEKISEDFPEGPDVSCELDYISESLQDYASPAMYFTPQIDNLTQNSIYINSASTDDDSMYTTLAHEGYPGHMYQMTYFANSDPDLIRYMIEPGGYLEGWATYCELYSYSYIDSGNTALNSLYQANYATILCLYAKVDIGINYYGWTVDDVASYIANYGYTDSSVAESMYQAMISQPGNYCQYVLGYIGFNELKKTAMSELGDSFNLKNFHQYILDMGPIQFDILNDHLEEWIETQR